MRAGKISLDRLGDFLATTELLDAFDSNSKEPVVAVSSIVNGEIGFRNATFMWSKEAAEHTAEAERSFKLRIDGELLFKRGTVNLIIGPTYVGSPSRRSSVPQANKLQVVLGKRPS